MSDALTFDEYQERSGATELPISPMGERLETVFYNGMALAGEAGEIAGKLSKALRDHGGYIPDDMLRLLRKEAGDVLWHLTRFVNALDDRLETIAQENLEKLASRKERGVLGGSGDER